MLETWNTHHLTRLDVTNPTSYDTSFYDHWMARYLRSNFFLNFESFENLEASKLVLKRNTSREYILHSKIMP